MIRAYNVKTAFLPLFVRYLLAFLLACGFIQARQKYALKSWLFVRGAAARFYLCLLRAFLFLVCAASFFCFSSFLVIVFRSFGFLFFVFVFFAISFFCFSSACFFASLLFYFRLVSFLWFLFFLLLFLFLSFVRWFSFFALLYSCTLFLLYI